MGRAHSACGFADCLCHGGARGGVESGRCAARSGTGRKRPAALRASLLALSRPQHGVGGECHVRSARVSTRPAGALLRVRDQRQEQPHAALGGCSDPGRDRRYLGICPQQEQVMTGPWRLRLLALELVAAGALAGPAAAAQALTVCLDEDIALYSVRHKDKGSGFFVALSEVIAQRLERPLKVQWFETKLDPDASRTLDANALLSDGRCELVGGYPLARGALGKPGMPTARMPDFEGAKPSDRRRRVQLGTLAPARAYQYAPLTVVLGPGVA